MVKELLFIVAIDCLLGAVDCVYESSDLFGLTTEKNSVLWYIKEHYCLMLFLTVSMNSYTIMFLSSDLREEVISTFKIPRWLGRNNVEKRRTPFITVQSS
ncbi:unnamed protein product [Strongylus vulgaris]|uniref:G-protein coupled receptors family 1 profile domain-containing protein n=1 Tax=Strongylus vulgaris TaxID=40348 RepID=A0A3P7ISS3_STRVU|nr:unnamed protein product [Strongylus vulgaris]